MLKRIQNWWLDNREPSLLAQLQTGEEAVRRRAFDSLMARHETNVRAFIWKYVPNYHDAGDVYQETTLKAYRFLDRFRGDCHFTTWLYEVARTCALDFIRRKTGKEVIPMEDVSLTLPSPHQPEVEVLQNEMGHPAVMELRERLSDEDFHLLWLREVEEKTTQEIAREVSMGEDNVKARFYRKINPILREVNAKFSARSNPKASESS
jgi:RNA polymerase sigma-70 factor, ECF subfamily